MQIWDASSVSDLRDNIVWTNCSHTCAWSKKMHYTCVARINIHSCINHTCSWGRMFVTSLSLSLSLPLLPPLSPSLVLTKGYSHSCCYRFLSRSGDWVWVRSKSNVCYDPVTHLPNGLNVYTWIVRLVKHLHALNVISITPASPFLIFPFFIVVDQILSRHCRF